MDYIQLNKRIVESFKHVKQDIIKLKEGQEKNSKNAGLVFDNIQSELKAINNKYLKQKEGDKLNDKLAKISKELEQIDNHSVKKTELNAKLLKVYSAAKVAHDAKKQINVIDKKISEVESTNQEIEDSIIDVESLKKDILIIVDNKINKFSEKLNALPSLQRQIKDTETKIQEIRSKEGGFVEQKDYNKDLEDIKKQSDLLISEINRMDAETVKNSEAGLIKARVTKAEIKIKDMARFRRDAKDIRKRLSKFSYNLNKLNEKLNLDKKILKEEEKIVEQKVKKASKKHSTKKTEGKDKLFKNAVDSVMDYFTEEPKKEEKKTAKKAQTKKK